MRLRNIRFAGNSGSGREQIVRKIHIKCQAYGKFHKLDKISLNNLETVNYCTWHQISAHI